MAIFRRNESLVLESDSFEEIIVGVKRNLLSMYDHESLITEAYASLEEITAKTLETRAAAYLGEMQPDSSPDPELYGTV